MKLLASTVVHMHFWRSRRLSRNQTSAYLTNESLKESEEWSWLQMIWTQKIDLALNVWLHNSVGRASHRFRGGHGFEFRWSPNIFQAFPFQLLKLEHFLRWSLSTFIYSRSTNMNFTYVSHRAVFKWLSKVITWLRLLPVVTGLEDSRQFFNQWKSKPKPIPPCTRYFSRALRTVPSN